MSESELLKSKRDFFDKHLFKRMSYVDFLDQVHEWELAYHRLVRRK